jgi:hypothetical protein
MKSLPFVLGLTVAMAGGSAFSQPPAARPAPAPGPSLALSMEMAQAAMASCKASGYTVAVSVIDSAGVLRLPPPMARGPARSGRQPARPTPR